MCITEQTHASVYLHIYILDLHKQQDIILIMLTGFINLLLLFH